jgi:hypothetical protein
VGIPYWSGIFENGSDETLVCSLLDGVGPDLEVPFEKAEDFVSFYVMLVMCVFQRRL